MRALPSLSFVLLITLFSVAGSAQNQSSTEGGDGQKNPWTEGQDAPAPDKILLPNTAPRESQSDETLDVLPTPTDIEKERPAQAQQFDDFATIKPTSMRHSNNLLRYGAFTMEEALDDVPGLWFIGDETLGRQAVLRGRTLSENNIRLNGVPLSLAATYPDFPILSLFAPDDFESVSIAQGAQSMNGMALGNAGSIDLVQKRAPSDLGDGLPVGATLRAGFGGADKDKFAHLGMFTGYRKLRLQFSAHAQDKDQRRPGREAPTILGSGGFKGGLLFRAEMPLSKAKLYAQAARARQFRSVASSDCLTERGDQLRDCVRADERRLDLLAVGVILRPFGLVKRALPKAEFEVLTHLQKAGTDFTRSGAGVLRTEKSFDDNLRTGALAKARFAWQRGALTIQPRLDAEWIRDRVDSSYRLRSRLTVDGDPQGDGRLIPQRSRRTDGSLSDLGEARVALNAQWRSLKSEAGLSAGTLTRKSPAQEGLHRAIDDQAFFLQWNLGLRKTFAHAAVFAHLARNQRPASLYDVTRGREDFTDGQLALALPSEDSDEEYRLGDRISHTAEVGIEHKGTVLDLRLALYAMNQDGDVREREIADETGILGVEFSQGKTQNVFGFEATANARLGHGLWMRSSFGTVLIEEGELFDSEGQSASTSATQVPPPRGSLSLHYTRATHSKDAPLDIFVRSRAFFPQPRLAPNETFDAQLCPSQQSDSCLGATFSLQLDAGFRWQAAKAIALQGALYNAVDSEGRQHGQPLPIGGIGARLSLTLSL